MKYALFLLFSFFGYSQQIKILGNIKDNNNRSIESASVVLLDSLENTVSYTYSTNTGYFELSFDDPKNTILTITVSSYGYVKKTYC